MNTGLGCHALLQGIFLIQGLNPHLLYLWLGQVAPWWLRFSLRLNVHGMQEAWAPSLGWEETLAKGMATHPNILAWRLPWTEQPGSQPSMGSQKVEWLTLFHFH